METPTILYLNNRYVNSLEELKDYFGSKLNEAQKGELIAAFRDKVLCDWLNEGGEVEKYIAGDMLPILDKHLGNGEVLKKIAELFDVPNPLIADYKFVDHAEYWGCDILGSDDEQTQHSTAPNDGVIHIKKGVTKCRIVFKFKILAPENDYLSLRLEISPKIENVMSWEMAKLDLVGKKNEIKTIELDIDVEKLCKDCKLTLSHDNTVVGRVTIDNHENTDIVVEATEETIPEGFQKADLVARVHTEKGYGFYNSHGRLVLKPELQLLKNDMYPDNGEFEFGFYSREVSGKMDLFYIHTGGYQHLGDGFVDAIPLNENYLAVSKDDTPYYGIIDKKGKTHLPANKYGEIRGVSKDGFMVCEVEKNCFKLVDVKGDIVNVGQEGVEEYIVNPKTETIYCYDDEGRVFCKKHDHMDYFTTTSFDYDVYVYDEKLVLRPNRKKSENKTFIYDEKGRVDAIHGRAKWQNSFIWRFDEGWISLHECNYVGNLYRWDGDPLVAKNIWVLVENSDNEICFYSIQNHFGDFGFTCEDVRMVNNCDTTNLFSVGMKDGTFYLVTEDSNGKLNPIELKSVNNNDTKLEDVVSYNKYICIHFTDSKTPKTLIVDNKGIEVLYDGFGNYEGICGPFEDCYYYLKNGDLYRKLANEVEGKRLSYDLHAKKLLPIGETGHFIICTSEQYYIIDESGKKLGVSFSGFNTPINDNGAEDIIMDYIYNSQYLPIKNKEGKCGLIDTNGKVIVPCEYDEVEDLNSIFKREGIVVF